MMIRPEDVERSACPLYGLDAQAAVPYTDGLLAIVACGACGPYYLSPRLKKAGMIVAVPDRGSVWRKAMGRRWPSFKFPGHVAYYVQRTSRALRASGFRRIEVVPYLRAFLCGVDLRKLGLPPVGRLRGPNVWLPGTTVVVAARLQTRSSP